MDRDFSAESPAFSFLVFQFGVLVQLGEMILFVGGNGAKNVKLILCVWKKGRQSPSLARGCLSSRKYAIHL
jgi:hypothetical protein